MDKSTVPEEHIFLRNLCKTLGLTLPPLTEAVLEKAVGPGDFWEVLDDCGVQVGRSFSQLSLCNYSLDDLYIYPHGELYDYDSWAIYELDKAQRMVNSGSAKDMILPLPSPFRQSEKLTEKKQVLILRRKFFSPLFGRDGRKYTLVVQSVSPARRLVSITDGIPDWLKDVARDLACGVLGSLIYDLLKGVVFLQEFEAEASGGTVVAMKRLGSNKSVG